MSTPGPELRCSIHPLDTLSPYKYVVICANYRGRWLLSRHRERDTWETQGGHIEPGETPMQAAVRELYEESGVTDADVIPVCDYHGYTDTRSSDGVVFLAVAHELGDLPDSEMAEVRLFDQLPENLTYPNVSPYLYQEASKHLPQTSLLQPNS
ncbi:MAG: NUDIX domain-containing protein [Clostridia bacterium]|nr:NUDIX domain-containing protein [Clostridia bacterium]